MTNKTNAIPTRPGLLRRALVPAATAAVLAAAVALGVDPASADKIELTDGTVLEGTVAPLGSSSYKITLDDGSMKIIKKSDVASVNGQSLDGGGSSSGGLNKPGSAKSGGSAGFDEVKRQADRQDEPIIAVSIWEKYLRGSVSEQDKAAAEAERDAWQELVDSGAEKIKGKWIGGEEREALMEKVKGLIEEGAELEESSTRRAIGKYREAIMLYPKSYNAHFRLGWFNLKKGGHKNVDAARASLEQAVRLRPDSPEALNNLAIAYNFDRNYARAVDCMWKAVQEADDEVLVQNLANALYNTPPRFIRSNNRIRDIAEDANVLFDKYGVRGGAGSWQYLPPGWSDAKRAEEGKPPIQEEGPPGIQGNGSGFFVTPDGYLLTNEHVAGKGEGYFYRVRLDGEDEEGKKVEYLARVIAVDDEHDVALLKVDLPDGETVPFIRLQPAEFPNPASEVMVLGYPATGLSLDKASMQVDTGTVKSNNEGDEYEVWFDLSTTHGNSGGPIVDRNGDLVAILSAGKTVHNVTYVLGVGNRQIRDFLSDVDDAPELPEGGQDDKPFDGETLAAEARQATLLVLIIRGELPDDIGDDDGESSTDGDEGDDADEETPGADEDEGGRPGIGATPGRDSPRRGLDP